MPRHCAVELGLLARGVRVLLIAMFFGKRVALLGVIAFV